MNCRSNIMYYSFCSIFEESIAIIIASKKSLSYYYKNTLSTVFAGIHRLKRYASCPLFSVKVMLIKSLVLPHINYFDVGMNDVITKQTNFNLHKIIVLYLFSILDVRIQCSIMLLVYLYLWHDIILMSWRKDLQQCADT